MRRLILGSVFLAGLALLANALVHERIAHAQGATVKNVTSKLLAGKSKADVKKYMKQVTEALGVQCDHCHDTDAMESDVKKDKVIARAMMNMVAEINVHKAIAKKDRVTCMTCHNGKLEPK